MLPGIHELVGAGRGDAARADSWTRVVLISTLSTFKRRPLQQRENALRSVASEPGWDSPQPGDILTSDGIASNTDSCALQFGEELLTT
jgi:hypothetical protein